MAGSAGDLWAIHDLLQSLRSLAAGWHLGPDHESAGRRSGQPIEIEGEATLLRRLIRMLSIFECPRSNWTAQRRAMAIAKSSRDRVSEDMARGSSLCPFAGKMTSRCTRVGGIAAWIAHHDTYAPLRPFRQARDNDARWVTWRPEIEQAYADYRAGHFGRI